MKRNTSHVLQHMLWRGLYFFSILLINIWIARYFAAEKSGQIFYIVNNLALVLLIVSISLESGATYYVASGKLDASLMANFCLVWATGASFIAVMGWGLALYLMNSLYLQTPVFLVSSFFFILGVLFTTYFTALFYAKKEFGLPNKILFIVNTALIILLIFGKNNSTLRTHFIEIYFFSFFLQGLLLRILFFRRYDYSGKRMFPEKSVLKMVIRYSLFALIANLVYFLVNRIDYWFVKFYCSEKDLGNYIQASKLAQMLLILPAILGSTLFPLFSSQDKSGSQSQLAAVVRVLLWVNAGICVLIFATGWYLIPLIFGLSFNTMYPLFLFLVPGILFITINYPLSAWFSATDKVRINLQSAIVALFIICVGDIFLLPRYGIKAAPIVSSVGFFSYFCYTIYKYRKETVVSWREFLLIRKSDLKVIFLSILPKKNAVSVENSDTENSAT
jgi:O-antigen/teichoic acid export membrane protein